MSRTVIPFGDVFLVFSHDDAGRWPIRWWP